MSANPMPAVTPAQIGALLTFVVSQAVAWGWIENTSGQRLVSIGGALVAIAWKAADAYLRAHRAQAVAANPTIATTQAGKTV